MEGAYQKSSAVSQVAHLVLYVATDLRGGEMEDGIFDGVEGGGGEESVATGGYVACQRFSNIARSRTAVRARPARRGSVASSCARKSSTRGIGSPPTGTSAS